MARLKVPILLATSPRAVMRSAPVRTTLTFPSRMTWAAVLSQIQSPVANENFVSCVTGSASPERVSQWCDWLEEPLDESLVAQVKEILKPIHNWVYVEGRPENNDG